MTAGEVDDMFARSRADLAGWLRDAGVVANARTVALAQRWLGYQPASTVQAMSRAVVDTTRRQAYEQALRGVFERTRVNLVAGERSRDGWDVPDWALSAAHLTVIPGAGHLMMAEEPQRFAETVGRLLADADARQAAD
jgi:lipase